MCQVERYNSTVVLLRQDAVKLQTIMTLKKTELQRAAKVWITICVIDNVHLT